MVAGCDGLSYYVHYDAFQGGDYQVKLDQLRPKARKVLIQKVRPEGGIGATGEVQHTGAQLEGHLGEGVG